METRREVELAATVDDVWACVTDPEALSAWLGGTFDVDGDGDSLAAGMTATFTEPDGAVRRVLLEDVSVDDRTAAWTWWTDDESVPPSGVSIAVEPAGDGADGEARVRVVVVERQLIVAGSVPRAMAMAMA